MSKKTITLHTMFNTLEEIKLDPNELYILFCIREKKESKLSNVFLSLRKLETDGFIVAKKESSNTYLLEQYTLTNKSEKLFSDLGLSGKSIASVSDITMEKVIQYNNLFPRRRAGSNHYMRSNPKSVKTALEWFFKTYDDYDWETIVEATSRYLDAEEAKDFKYTSTSVYFIKKADASRTVVSKLADWCQAVKDGEEIVHRPNFTDKAT